MTKLRTNPNLHHVGQGHELDREGVWPMMLDSAAYLFRIGRRLLNDAQDRFQRAKVDLEFLYSANPMIENVHDVVGQVRHAIDGHHVMDSTDYIGEHESVCPLGDTGSVTGGIADERHQLVAKAGEHELVAVVDTSVLWPSF